MRTVFSASAIQGYLYCDTRRVDGYLARSGRPLERVGMRKSTVPLNLPAPGATLHHDSHPIEPSDQRKVLLLIDRLHSRRELIRLDDLPTAEHGSATFVVGTVKARSIVIPPGQSTLGKGVSLSFWFSEPFPTKVRLYLVQDFPRSDLLGLDSLSSCTVLSILAHEMSEELAQTALHESARRGRGSWELFVRHDPLAAFESLGCIVGDERHIGFLARMRACFREPCGRGAHAFCRAFFSYPMAIVEVPPGVAPVPT